MKRFSPFVVFCCDLIVPTFIVCPQSVSAGVHINPPLSPQHRSCVLLQWMESCFCRAQMKSLAREAAAACSALETLSPRTERQSGPGPRLLSSPLLYLPQSRDGTDGSPPAAAASARRVWPLEAHSLLHSWAETWTELAWLSSRAHTFNQASLTHRYQFPKYVGFVSHQDSWVVKYYLFHNLSVEHISHELFILSASHCVCVVYMYMCPKLVLFGHVIHSIFLCYFKLNYNISGTLLPH